MGGTAENTALSTCRSKRDAIAREFFRMLNDEQKRKYLDLESAAISAECDIAEALYMKGAADREMMIR